MAEIHESPFYVPAKRNFLEKLRNYSTITFCFVEWKNKEDETKSKGLQLLLSPISLVGIKGTYCCSCQGISSLEGNWASNLVTENNLCFLNFFFQVQGESISVPECPWKLYLVACFPMIFPAYPRDVVHPEANLRKERPWHQYFWSFPLLSSSLSLECTNGYSREQNKGPGEVADTTNLRKYKLLIVNIYFSFDTST